MSSSQNRTTISWYDENWHIVFTQSEILVSFCFWTREKKKLAATLETNKFLCTPLVCMGRKKRRGGWMSLLYMLLLPLLLCVCRLVQSAPAAAPFLLATRKDLCAEWCSSSSSTVSGLLLELFGCKYVAEPPPLLQSHTFLWMHLLAAAFAWLCSSSIIMNQF